MATSNTSKAYVALMVDDDEDDWLLVKDAFDEVSAIPGFRIDLHHVWDGQELFEYLERGGEQAPNPDLILLDLNMPRMDGREALKRLKSHSTYRDIPVVILTTSHERADVLLCEQSGADLFFTKPDTYEELIKMIDTVSKRWFSATKQPSQAF